MSVKRLAKTEKVGILQQSKASNHWSAPAAASANFYQMNWLNAGTPNPNPDVQIDQINSISQNGTHKELERFFIDEASGMPTLPIAGIADKKEMAPLLVSAFQAVSEAATTPYLKTITAAGLTGPVDWAGNGGYLFTVAINQGASADDGIILENGIVDTLNIVWDLNARGQARMASYSGTMKFNDIKYEQTLSGTWTNTSAIQSFFNKTSLWGVTYDSIPTFTVDSVDYSAQCIRRVELQINNNITSNCKTTGGKANQYDWAPEYKVLFSLDYNSATEKILADFQTGAVATFTWSNDTAGAQTDGMWSFYSVRGQLLSPPKVYNGDFLGINLEIGLFSQAGTTPITMYYTDTIDWAY